MQQEIFVFIKDEFFTKYDQNGYLMRNKGDRHSRPCFLAFSDKKEPNILWCVPISSQTEKFEKIVKSKIAKQQKMEIILPNAIQFVLEMYWAIKRLF